MRQGRSTLLGSSVVGRVSVWVVTAVLSTGLAGTAWAAGPAPVSGLTLSSTDAKVFARWTSSPDTSQAKVCWALNTPPSSPSDVGAQCSEVLSTTRYDFDAVTGQQYGVSVFSYDSSTSAYGEPVSDTITAQDPPPVQVEDLRSEGRPYSGTAVDFYWTDPANHDTKSYLVSLGEGMDTPDYDPVTDSEVHGHHGFEYGLKPAQVYTLAVRVKDDGNNVGPPAVLHFTTRTPGLWAADDRAGDVDRDQVPLQMREAAVSGQSDGHLRAVYLSPGHVMYTSRIRSQKWGEPISISGQHPHHGLRDLFIASTVQGDVAAVWSAGQGVVLAERTSGHWHTRHVSRHNGDRAAGVTLDRRGNLHVLVRRTTAAGGGLLLVTRHGRDFVTSRFTGSGRYDTGLLTQDRVTRDLAVVDEHAGSRRSTISLAVLPAASDAIRHVRTVLDRARDDTAMLPTSVVSAGGRVTLAVERRTTGGADSDGVFTFTVTAKSVGSPARVPHTTQYDTHAVLVAADVHRVVVSWRRTDPNWSPDAVGIWVTQLVDGTGDSTAPRRWSSSAYDVPLGTFRDDRGHFYATALTAYGDVVE